MRKLYLIITPTTRTEKGSRFAISIQVSIQGLRHEIKRHYCASYQDALRCKRRLRSMIDIMEEFII